MASVSVSHLILFIASLLIAASVAGTLVTGVDRVSNAVSDHSVILTEEIETDVTIISDAGSEAVYDPSTETTKLYVKNTGSRALVANASQLDVMLDGAYMTDISVEPIQGDSWAPNEVVLIEIDQSLSAGDHRVVVIVNGNRDLFRFRVE